MKRIDLIGLVGAAVVAAMYCGSASFATTSPFSTARSGVLTAPASQVPAAGCCKNRIAMGGGMMGGGGGMGGGGMDGGTMGGPMGGSGSMGGPMGGGGSMGP